MEAVKLGVRTSISPSEIIFFEADVNYTRIHYQDHSEIVAISLKKVEQQLKAFPFYRIHKSYLINLNYISNRIDKYEVEMINNRSLSISRRKIVMFRRLLKKRISEL